MPKQTTTPTTRRRLLPAVAGIAFAAALIVGPIVATSGVDAGGSEQSHSGYTDGTTAARTALTIEAAFEPITEPAPPPEAPAAVPAPAGAPAVIEPAVVTPTVPTVPSPVRSPELETTLTLSNPNLADGSAATWKITVTNQSDEYLWGVYAYLEGFGAVTCGSRQLDAGESTTCWADDTVWAGTHEAAAWATAWTVDRMVEEGTALLYTVGP